MFLNELYKISCYENQHRFLKCRQELVLNSGEKTTTSKVTVI